MTDSALNTPSGDNSALLAIKKLKKIILFISLFILALTAIFIFYISTRPVRDKEYEKQYKKEMKQLAFSLDSLKKENIIRLEKENKILEEIDYLRREKGETSRMIQQSLNLLTTIKKEYEKNPTYTGLGIDSVHRIFTATFNY